MSDINSIRTMEFLNGSYASNLLKAKPVPRIPGLHFYYRLLRYESRYVLSNSLTIHPLVTSYRPMSACLCCWATMIHVLEREPRSVTRFENTSICF